MAVVTVNEDVCKGCALCVDACPKHIMELDTSHLNKKGYHPAHVTCPDVAITVEK